MTSFVAVLPAIAPDLAHSCIESMTRDLRHRLVLVDNTKEGRIAHCHPDVFRAVPARTNAGVPLSWNVGIEVAQAQGAEYLIIVSQSITFGLLGGRDFLDLLDATRPAMFLDAQYGWKLIAVNVAAFTAVGVFDPWFSPALYEESDWMRRAHWAGLCSPWYNDLPGREQCVTIDATSAGDAVAMRRGLVEVDSGVQRAKYITKHGGDPRKETFDHPYGLERLDWTYTGPPPVDAVPPPAFQPPVESP